MLKIFIHNSKIFLIYINNYFNLGSFLGISSIVISVLLSLDVILYLLNNFKKVNAIITVNLIKFLFSHIQIIKNLVSYKFDYPKDF